MKWAENHKNPGLVVRLGGRFWAASLPGAEGVGCHTWTEAKLTLGWSSSCCPLPFLLHMHSWGKRWGLLNLVGPLELPSVMVGGPEARKLCWPVMGHGGDLEASTGCSVELRSELGPHTLTWTLNNTVYSGTIHAWPREFVGSPGWAPPSGQGQGLLSFYQFPAQRFTISAYTSRAWRTDTQRGWWV